MRTRMLTVSLLAAALLAAPAVLAAAGPSTGPYVGAVAQGETDTYSYDTHGGQPCLAVWMPRLYVVTLAYLPPGDTVTLTAGGKTDVGQDGTASVSFVANYCTQFAIEVEGTAVEDLARYTVTVQSSPLEGQIASTSSASMCPSVQECASHYYGVAKQTVLDLLPCDPPDNFDIPVLPDC